MSGQIVRATCVTALAAFAKPLYFADFLDRSSWPRF
jgi:hypothetical protein